MIALKELAGHIKRKLEMELPGKKAHFKMVPEIRLPEFGLTPDSPRNSSVLILLYPKNDQICIVLIKRPEYPGVHSGQVSLPGGKSDETDSSIEATALREANEEVGVDTEAVHIIGQLSKLFVSPSNFMIYPVIGYMLETPVFVGDNKEVAQIFDIPVRDLLNSNNIKRKSIRLHRGTELVTPYYDIQGLTIWGATAMILSEFAAVIADFKDFDQGVSSI